MPEISEAEVTRRLWDRLGFGPPAAEDRQSTDPAATAAALSAPGSDDPGVAATAPPELLPWPERMGDPSPEQRRERARIRRENRDRLVGWWLRRMVAAREPLPEKLAWLWHGHFATSLVKVGDARLMLGQNQTLRRLGLGSFTDLVQAMAVDPAMLIWLDGTDNSAKAPNENLAREMLELFTLGPGHYGEADVTEGARALTGWQVDRRDGRARFVPRRHDRGDKTVLGVTGPLDADGFVSLALEQPASPEFVITRLWSRLVTQTPPDRATMDRLLAAYGPRRDVAAVITALTAAPAFTDAASTLVKSPVDWAVGLVRVLGGADGLPVAMTAPVGRALLGLGQRPFLPPDVGGWPEGRVWLTSATAAARLQAARTIVTGLSADDRISATGPAARVEEAADVLGIEAWSPASTAALTAVAQDARSLLSLAACTPEYVVSR